MGSFQFQAVQSVLTTNFRIRPRRGLILVATGETRGTVEGKIKFWRNFCLFRAKIVTKR